MIRDILTKKINEEIKGLDNLFSDYTLDKMKKNIKVIRNYRKRKDRYTRKGFNENKESVRKFEFAMLELKSDIESMYTHYCQWDSVLMALEEAREQINENL